MRLGLVALCKKIVALLRELFWWRWLWEAEAVNHNAVYEVPVDSARNTTTDDNRLPLYDTIVQFCHFHRGREPILHTTAVLLILDDAEF